MGRDNLFLVGMMGAGKTTVGRLLARRLRREFVDADRALIERTGVPIHTIFEIEGEEGFRRREAQALAELAAGEQRVIATGGGAVLDPGNRRLMRDSGTVVYLRARPDDLWERLRHDTSRPLLATADPRGKLEALLAERDPLYRECAHIVVDTGRQSASTLVSRVFSVLRRQRAEILGG